MRKLFRAGRLFKDHPEHATILPVKVEEARAKNEVNTMNRSMVGQKSLVKIQKVRGANDKLCVMAE
jgi:hypothetical protein